MSPEMESVGRNMVKRCKGLPLAISSLGGLLKGKSLLSDWEKINNDISFYLAKGKGVDDEYYTVTQILGLSYDSLPPRLKHCFLCFANYEEDEIIWTEELYMFWMGEGLISVEDKAKGEMMLDVAERYLEELARRNLVEVETSESLSGKLLWSKYKICRVHDLIRDLCLSKVKEEKVISVVHFESNQKSEYKASIVRRLCIRRFDIRSHYDSGLSLLKHNDRHSSVSHLRSLLVWKEPFNTSKFDDMDDDEVISFDVFSQSITAFLYQSKNWNHLWPDEILSLNKFKLLRVLTVRQYNLTKQHIRDISELIFLKYLCLAGCKLEELPSSIGNLRNLENLDLRVWNTISVPNVLRMLKQLKHLYLPDDLKGGGDGKMRFEGLNELELIHNFNQDHCDADDLIRLPKLRVYAGILIADGNLSKLIQDDYTKENSISKMLKQMMRNDLSN